MYCHACPANCPPFVPFNSPVGSHSHVTILVYCFSSLVRWEAPRCDADILVQLAPKSHASKGKVGKLETPALGTQPYLGAFGPF